MKTPEFWKNRNIISELLMPISVVYFFLLQFKKIISSQKPEKLNVPIICIGNATVGGAGKTPTAIAIAKILQKQNKKTAFISRGYKGKLKDAVRVDLEKHTAEEVGDEPLLLAKIAPCFVSRDRIAAAKLAISDGAEIIIMDDGLQNESIYKDLSILVVDGGYGFGNMLPIPAGPLRERVQDSIKKCNAVILIGEDKIGTSLIIRRNCADLEKYDKIKRNIFKADISPVIHENISNKKFVAFAGIARPQKFFDSLKSLNAELVESISFADHHYFSKSELDELHNKAKEHQAELITTEKDYIRIPKEMRDKIRTMPIKIKWDNEEETTNLLKLLI